MTMFRDYKSRIVGIGQPVDVAGAVVFLASDAAVMITADVMLIDGGWTIS